MFKFCCLVKSEKYIQFILIEKQIFETYLKTYQPLLIVIPGNYSITCIQRPLKGRNESVLLLQTVFKCRFYKVDLKRVAVSEEWALKAGGLLIQVVSNTGLTVYQWLHGMCWQRDSRKVDTHSWV